MNFGWQYVFWTMGGLGLLLTPAWFLFVHSPKDDPHLSREELACIEQGGGLVNMDLGGKPAAGFQRELVAHPAIARQPDAGRRVSRAILHHNAHLFLHPMVSRLFGKPRHVDLESRLRRGPAGVVRLHGRNTRAASFPTRLLKPGRSLSFARKLPIVLGMLLSCVMIVCNYVGRTGWSLRSCALPFSARVWRRSAGRWCPTRRPRKSWASAADSST